MAGSRLEKFGTIYKRVQGLIRSGALKPVDRPMWCDVYEAFPPRDPPVYERPIPDRVVPQILYPEDIIRAQFYKTYGNPDVFDLPNKKVTSSTCQKFVEKYLELLKAGTPKDKLFETTAAALREQGIRLRSASEMENSSVQQPSTAQPSSPKLEQLSVASIFGEQTARKAETEEQDFIVEDDVNKDPKL